MPFSAWLLRSLIVSVALLAPVSIATAQEVASVPDAQSPAPPARAWLWSVTPYVWASSVDEAVTMNDRVVSGGKTEFRDLLDVIDASFQVHLEGLHDRWGPFADLAYFSLSDTKVGDRELLRFEVELEETLAEAGVVYRPAGRDGSFDLLAGGRYLGVDEKYRLRLGSIGARNATVNEDFFDALIGARYAIRLSDRWVITLRGDVSFGGTDGIWTGQGLLGWRFGKFRNSAIFIGYRYRDMKYAKAKVLDVHKTLSGAGFGVRFGF